MIRTGTNSAAVARMISPSAMDFGGCGADVADDNFKVRDRRGQELVNRPGKLGKVNAEGSVGDALGEERQHDQSRHDEGAVGDAVDLGHARADGRAEDDEV